VTVDGAGNPKVDYTISEPDAKRLREASKRAMEAYFAAGAAECYTGHVRPFRATSTSGVVALDGWGYGPGEVGIISYHQMGTVRMGGDRQRHAADPDGRLWGLENVYVADSSLFPTASGVNPQITVYGMAMRVAERLRDRLG
jgi:choline dehydrogenase-like flavoprotein